MESVSVGCVSVRVIYRDKTKGSCLPVRASFLPAPTVAVVDTGGGSLLMLGGVGLDTGVTISSSGCCDGICGGGGSNLIIFPSLFLVYSLP